MTGEVSEGGLWVFVFFGGGVEGEANVCNVAQRRRQLKKSITLTCAFCFRTRRMLVCFLTVNKPHDGPSLLTSLRTHLCPHGKKNKTFKAALKYFFFVNKLYNYYSFFFFFNLSFKKDEVLHSSGGARCAWSNQRLNREGKKNEYGQKQKVME